MAYFNPAKSTKILVDASPVRLGAVLTQEGKIKGKGKPADYLSRHPGQEVKTFRHSKIAEEYLNFIASSSKPKALTIKQITDASNKDPVIQEVTTIMLKAEWESSPNDPCILSYFVNRDKLTIAPTEYGSILLFENRLVIPEHLQKTVVELAHEGHQGIVKKKQLLGDKVWFPGINQLVEEICKKYIPCAASTPTKHESWSRVSADFCGPFPTGEYLLVVIDDHSRYPVVEVLRSTSARTVINFLIVRNTRRTENG